MIETISDTTTSAIAKKLVQMREQGGVTTLGRVLTLIITLDELGEAAIEAANQASGEHPMRVIVLHFAGSGSDQARLDAEIRVGGDAGASEVIVLHVRGAAGDDPGTLVQGLLLPDAPIVSWWPGQLPDAPSRTALGQLAQRRIVDTAAQGAGPSDLARLREGFASGDSDLAWARITGWRAQLAAVLDQEPYEPVRSAEVCGLDGSPSALLMAAWLRLLLDVPVRVTGPGDELLCGSSGLGGVRLHRGSGVVHLDRVSEGGLRLIQPGQPPQLIPVPVRDLTDLLAEELRSLAPDRVLAEVISRGVPMIQTEASEGTRA